MTQGRMKNTVLNATYGLINQIIIIFMSFISRTIFIKVLGVEYLGINGLFADVLTMLSMADLGLLSAMMYSFYKPLADDNKDKIAALVNLYKKLYITIAIFVALIGVAVIPFLGYIVNLDSSIPYLKIYYLFFLANTVISYLFVYKTAVINADQKNYLISKYQARINIGRGILQIIFLLITKNYFSYLIIEVLATVTNNLVASRKADKLYPYIKESNIKLEKDEKRNIFENVKSIFIYKVSSVLLTGTDNTIISMMLGTIWVGYYSNYNLVINAINKFINILYTAASASIGNAVVKESPKKRFEIFSSMQVISSILTTFTTVCLFVLLNDLIYVWLGEKYVLDYIILISIMLNFYFGGIVHPIWSFRESTGMYVKTKYIMTICAIENIILSIILGKYMGMAGILFASAISRITTYFWYEPKILFNEFFKDKVSKFYIPLVKNLLLTVVISYIFKNIFSYIKVDSWATLFMKSIIVALSTLIIVIIAYRKKEEYKLVVEKAKVIVKR